MVHFPSSTGVNVVQFLITIPNGCVELIIRLSLNEKSKFTNKVQESELKVKGKDPFYPFLKFCFYNKHVI